jgi:cyanophycin synthetase
MGENLGSKVQVGLTSTNQKTDSNLKNKASHIPIIAVTGTNGKTTTTRLVAYILKQAGFKVGFTCSDGIYINGELIEEGDCSGPVSAASVLKNENINFAVLECARGGILRAGLAFDQCDVAVINNVAEDHLDLKGINTLQQLADVKAIVALAVKPDGYAILNADDELVYAIHEKLSCKLAYFSHDPQNQRIVSHCAKGGIAIVPENDCLTILCGDEKISIDTFSNIPITFNGKADFNISNAMAASLAAFLAGVNIEDIREALRHFVPSVALTPGRMNFFQFLNFSVIVDFAHNPHGMKAVSKLVSSVDATIKIAIIAGTGDRRDEDIIHLAEESAKIFDELIIRQDVSFRGRPGQEIIDLVLKGIRNIDPSKKATVIEQESDAIDFAFKTAPLGSLIFITSDQILNAVNYVQQLKEKEETSI